MSSFDHSRSLERESRFKNIIILMLFMMSLASMYGWHKSPEDIDLHYPPSLTDGGVMRLGEVPDYEVYQLTQRVIQNLNYWGEDGEIDYPKNIKILRYFFSNVFKKKLYDDLAYRKGKTKENRKNILKGRTRSFAPLLASPYSADRVNKVSDSSWVVWLDFRVKEEFNGHPLKDVVKRYSYVVVLSDVNRDFNQWRLQISDYYKKPEFIEDVGK